MINSSLSVKGRIKSVVIEKKCGKHSVMCIDIIPDKMDDISELDSFVSIGSTAEAERKAEEERIRLEAEARERELAEKIEVVLDDEEEKGEEQKKERPEDKLYDYNGKKIKANLLKSDVTDDIKEKAFEMGFLALTKFTAEKEMSEFVKSEFDTTFEPEWQIVIGKDFSVAFSFEIENFIFFQIEDIYFLFYKL